MRKRYLKSFGTSKIDSPLSLISQDVSTFARHTFNNIFYKMTGPHLTDQGWAEIVQRIKGNDKE